MEETSTEKHFYTYRIGITLVSGLILLLGSLIASLSIGVYHINFSAVMGLLLNDDGSKAASIIHTIRLPRAVIGMLIGGCLAIAGAIMQSITNNPLASPQIFGVNAGASLMVVIGVVLLPDLAPNTLVYFAFFGAAVGGATVYYLASTGGGMTPVKLALAGITIHLFLSSIIEGVVLFNETSTEDVLFWLAGGIDGRNWGDVKLMLPWAIVGVIASFALSKSLTLLSLGDDVARGLGQKIGLIRFVSSLLVVILAGASVAVAGPIGFIGLMIPNIVRKIIGSDYRFVIPISAVLGALLLTVSDVISRFIAFPAESPVGIVTALIGAPFFLYLARKGGREA
ncbi:iron ABC transporter permease [Halobacillus sp. BBL2006]|uniref:FecCD family ABC transporter permease n=1 Tax=Halobacillus sp. BBL2006 TaxID=1543706 RepID=UPI00054343B9|nr:iron ABC transporter permease [Halobacillus sp. BBL2006]KHE66981.1 siderophore ABC transporter permease [Halobacillus sp. BBL2006]